MLEGIGLAAFRGERLVFADLGLRLAAGDALVVLGANGAGKSTLLRVLAGLLPPAAGSLTWNGADMHGDDIMRIGYLGHQDAVKPGLTVAENLRFAQAVSRTAVERGSVADAIAAVGLAELADLPARLLSAGQRRRLALARLPLSKAPLWLLDEPTLGLDARAIAQLATMLAAHRAGGGIIVTATHLALPLDAPTVLHMTS